MDVSTSCSGLESMNEDSDENKLEITRNPFDSNLYEKDNFPVLDASVFTDSRRSSEHQESPASSFRWSIDQMAKLQPADLDMFPNQEYSVAYERKEDEERDQQQVDEYFKNVLLPSPWLDNRAEFLKRVTFSPHPPATRYINNNENDDSELSSTSDDVADGVVKGSRRDAGCQTTLTLPFDFDLMALIGAQYYTYVNETIHVGSTNASIASSSSLRRKLFDQETNSGTNGTPVRHGLKSLDINTPGYVTSSPTSSSGDSRTPSLCLNNKEIGAIANNLNSSNVEMNESNFFGAVGGPGGCSSTECSPIKQASNVGTPIGKRQDISFSSVDVSPISSCEKDPTKKRTSSLEEDAVESFSFLPDVTVDPDALEESVFESSRAARFASPDISPIGKTAAQGLESMENITNPLQQQSIKESTARNLHAFSGLEFSSIVESTSLLSKLDDVQEDKGPLDITELEPDDEEQDVVLTNDQTDVKTEDNNSPPLKLGDLERETVETPKPEKPTNSAKMDQDEDPAPTPKIILTPTTPNRSQLVATPLKGILKHREVPSSSGKSKENSVEETKFNTERNTGRARSRILQSLTGSTNLPRPILIGSPSTGDSNDDVSPSPIENDEQFKWSWPRGENVSFGDEFVCRRALSAMKRSLKVSSYLEEEIFDKENSSPFQSTTTKQRRKYQLNSTAVASGSGSSSSMLRPLDFAKISTDDVFEEGRTDSGVSSMDWVSDPNLFRAKLTSSGDAATVPVTPKNDLKSFSISPVMNLRELHLRNGNTPGALSANKKNVRSPYVYRASPFLNRSGCSLQSPMSRASAQSNRSLIYDRSHSWPTKGYPHQQRSTNSRFSSLISPPSSYNMNRSKDFIPRSRVTPTHVTRSKSFTWRSTKDQSVFKTLDIGSSYKDFLPSPLK
eukprot:TCONS_00028358-protein